MLYRSLPLASRHQIVSYIPYLQYSTSVSFNLNSKNERYDLLNNASNIIELNKNWRLLHKPFKYPSFSDYCKMLQMLRSFKNFSEISSIYEEFLNLISYPPQNHPKWKNLDPSNNPMHVTQIMRCCKIANDWNTMYHFLQIYIQNNWKFNKVSAQFALECCWRYNDDIDDLEDTVINIWNNVKANNIVDQYCFIQLLHCIDKKFEYIGNTKQFMSQILTDLNKYPNNDKNKLHLDMIIYNQMLGICQHPGLEEIANEIAQKILEPNSNLFFMFSDLDDNMIYIRHGAIPLKLMVKLLHLYCDTKNVDGALELFEIMKRFRSISLQSINKNIKGEDRSIHDLYLRRWESEIFNHETLPLFVKIIYDYVYSLVINQQTISKSLLIEYRNKAEVICKYVNYNLSIPTMVPSLYLCAIDYLIGNINSGNKLTMNVLEKSFDIIDGDHDNEYSLLKQWQNGQFVLNLSKDIGIPDIMYIPLIISSLIFYAKTIPKQDKELRSIKIRINADHFESFKQLFGYLSVHYPPNIDRKIIGKLPSWMIVIELDLNSLLKWCEYHNMVYFQDSDKQQMRQNICENLLPQIDFNKDRNTASSFKQIFQDLKVKTVPQTET